MGSVEDCPPSRLLEVLPTRPPTPPRGTIHHDLDPLAKQLIATQQRSLQTPPGLSSPSTSSSKDSSTRRKRVGFSAKAQFQEAPAYSKSKSIRQNPTPASLPPSTSRPVKGILKPTTAPNRLGPVTGVSLDGDKPGQIHVADMLESTLQQLAGADRESKIDAYTMLFRGLKASSNLPDRIALQEKMGLFMQFIQRDLTSKAPSGNIDILLVTTALKLLHTFLHFHGVASSIPRDFGIFFIEHCVRSFDDELAPKETTRHIMQALFLQNFPSEVMTFERVGRLIEALHNIESHLSGKSIVLGRIRVYEKLVKQCPQQMAVHSDWMQDLFTDMLSSAAEIRSAATKLGLSAAFTLNKDKRLVSRALELLNLTLEDKKYVELIADRLNIMLEDKEESVSVPRIWSVITLFIPNLEQWDYFKPWSSILQRSFNHQSNSINKEALLAWSRFTYRKYLDRRLDHHIAIKLIREPLLSKLRRRVLRNSVLSSIRNFYYYAFRPDVNLKMLDELWDSAIAPLMQRLSSIADEDDANVTQAAAILTSLLDCKTRRVWREDRITDSASIKDDELPAIESKWVRANSSRVLELVGPLLKRGFAELAVSGSQYQKLWRAVVHSVASASAKDVKLHDDTAKFTANAFTLLSTIWSEGPCLTMSGQPCSSSQFLDSTRDFVHILVSGLGLLPNPFMDKQFIQTKDNKFIVHTASSHRSSKGTRRSPLHHLFLILARSPTSVPDDSEFAKFFDLVFAPFFEDKNEKAQANLAHELLRLLPMDATCSYGPWSLCATRLSTSLEASQFSDNSNGSGSGGNLGPEFREIVKTLERGLRSTPNLPSECWIRLFQNLTSRARDDAGDAGVAIAVVEPLASVISDLIPDEKEDVISNLCVDATIELVATSTHPRDRQAVDAARKRLWGTTNVGNRSSSFDPFDNLYKLLTSVLEKLYANIGSYDLEMVVQLLKQVRSLFDRGNPELVFRTLLAIREGLTRCLEDEDHRLTRTEFPGVAEAVSLSNTSNTAQDLKTDTLQIRGLWQTLSSVISANSTDNLQLDLTEPLLCAAFASTHREIVNITANMWNQVYGCAEHIDYPARLKDVLSSLGPSVDVVRPGLEIPDEESDRHANFSESQDQSLDLPVASLARLQPTPQPRRGVISRSATPGSAKAQDGFQDEPNANPAGRTGGKGRTPRSKPRHEDSQLEFTAIGSPPALVTETSEVLTDRQREVRERQQENAALFPEIRSSPTEKTKKARSNTTQNHPETASRGITRACTPDNERDFEDCLTSTPTPRRGQSAMLPEQDHDMTDPPSSPPEPRGHRLLAELKAQAIDKSSVDEWQFSSSPISGSPNVAHPTLASSQLMELDDVTDDLRLDEDNEDSNADISGVETTEVYSSQPEVIEETTILEPAEVMALPAMQQATGQRSPTTPSGRQLRSRTVQITPRSDNEEFVDARSSPLPPTPSQHIARKHELAPTVRRSPRNAANSQSFAVSASFENGLRGVSSGRIEIPLRSSERNSPRKKQYVSYKDILPVSPEQAHEEDAESAHQVQQPAHEQETNEQEEALESIEVGGISSTKSKRGRSRKSKRAPSASSSQPSNSSQPLKVTIAPPNDPALADTADEFENVSPGIGRWWRKRKRSISSIFSSGGSKKARHHDVLSEETHQDQDEVPHSESADVGNEDLRHDEIPDSQPADMTNQAVPASPKPAESLDHGVETQMLEELYEHDISLDSNPSSSPKVQPQRELSEELSAADDQPTTETEPPVEAATEMDLQMDGIGDHTDDDEAVNSQLTREEEEACIERERSMLPDDIAAGPQPIPQPTMQTEEVSEVVTEQQPAETAEPSKFDDLMSLLRNGMATLRSTDLTREQFYQAEDMFFEMKRELLEAERRGRTGRD